MNKFNVGDTVTFKPSPLLNYWKVRAGILYTVLDVSGRLITICDDKGGKSKFDIAHFNYRVVENEPLLEEATPTAWKIDEIHFTDEGNGNISIFGNGDITISIEHLKTILDTVQGT